jgi:hypothetical protein
LPWQNVAQMGNMPQVNFIFPVLYRGISWMSPRLKQQMKTKKNQKIIISNNYRKIDTKKSEERYEPEIAFSGSMVNSNDKILNDLLLTNIRA